MKEINLRDYYPFYTQDAIVEVPDEVAALLYELKLAEAASFLRTYRHKAYFSLDYGVFLFDRILHFPYCSVRNWQNTTGAA